MIGVWGECRIAVPYLRAGFCVGKRRVWEGFFIERSLSS